MPDPHSVSIATIAQLLNTKSKLHSRMVLLLGSRAGGLFRNNAFYETLAPFSIHDFSRLSQDEQFAECYKLLTQTQRPFSKSDIYSLLRNSLQQTKNVPADHYLAELIKQKYFDEIITTNIDDLLEQAFSKAGVQALHDYEVLLPQQGTQHPDTHHWPYINEHLICRLHKIFGDLASREYTIDKRFFYFDKNPALKSLLERLLMRDILAIGFDPVWDEGLLRIFPVDAGTMWFVNEEDLTSHPSVSTLLQTRNTWLIQGSEGSYEHFITALHQYLKVEKIIEIDQTTPESTAGKQQDTTRRERKQTDQSLNDEQTLADSPPFKDKHKKHIFVSYSRKDKKYLQRLQVHLDSLRDELEVWHDAKILPGALWFKEIERALENADVAIMLVSADFLASKFIAEVELSRLLQAAKEKGTAILPIIVNHCSFKRSPLSQFQAVNDPKQPLSAMSADEREKVWVRVIDAILESNKKA